MSIFNFFTKKNKPPTATKVKEVLESLDLANPKNNAKFNKIIPFLHKHNFALKFINTYGHVEDCYVEGLLKHHQNRLPLEVEQAIIECPETNLLFGITSRKYKWSPKAKKLIKKIHPNCYHLLFKNS